MDKSHSNPNCRRCEFFFVTWEKNRPYGCRAFGFKSKRLPALEVYHASGKHCLKFIEKKRN